MKGAPNQGLVFVSYSWFFCLSFVFHIYIEFCCSALVVSTSAIDCLERLISEITYYVSSGSLSPTYSILIHLLTYTKLIQRKLQMCGHMGRMSDDGKIKLLVFWRLFHSLFFLYLYWYVSFIVLWSGVLCVVWCTDWLHIHHCKLHRTVGEMVEKPRAGPLMSCWLIYFCFQGNHMCHYTVCISRGICTVESPTSVISVCFLEYCGAAQYLVDVCQIVPLIASWWHLRYTNQLLVILCYHLSTSGRQASLVSPSVWNSLLDNLTHLAVGRDSIRYSLNMSFCDIPMHAVH